MTHEELQNRWDTEVGKHIHRGYSTESRPSEVVAFLKGESETIADKHLQLLFMHDGYPKAIIAEAEAGGETAELALRMLKCIDILSRDDSYFVKSSKDVHAGQPVFHPPSLPAPNYQ
jgi:hypothetical protein